MRQVLAAVRNHPLPGQFLRSAPATLRRARTRPCRGQFRRLTLHFSGGLDQGQGLQFGVDRHLALSPFHDTSEGNGADELGGATFFPSGRIVRVGLVFRAELANVTSFTGVMRNKIGPGFSPIDGDGLVNAQRAVFGS